MKAHLLAAALALPFLAAPALADNVEIQGRLRYDPPLTQDDVLANGMCYVLDGLDVITYQGLDSDGEISTSVDVPSGTRSLSLFCTHDKFEPIRRLLPIQNGRVAVEQTFNKPRTFYGAANVDTDGQSTAFDVSFPVDDVELVDVETSAGTFQRMRLRTGDILPVRDGLSQVSFPETPVHAGIVALPLGKNMRVEVVPESPKVIENVRLYPVQPPNGNKDGAAPPDFVYDPEKYARGGAQVTEPIGTATIGVVDANVQRLLLNGVDYDPASKRLTLYRKLKIRVVYGQHDGCFRRIFQDPNRPLDPIEKEYERIPPPTVRVAVNYLEWKNGGCTQNVQTSRDGARLLIVAPPVFLAPANALKAHKQARGLSTEVVSTATIARDHGNGRLTPEAIKAYILKFNLESAVKLRYLLLIGDSELIPTYYDRENENIFDSAYNAGDAFYGQLTNDFGAPPTLGIGRLPVDPTPEAGDPADSAWTVVRKIMNFENDPPRDDRYYGTATFAAYFQDAEPDGVADLFNSVELVEREMGSVLKSVNHAYQRVYKASPNSQPTTWQDRSTPIDADLRRPQYGWTGDANQLMSQVQAGSFLLVHRGHGWWDRWAEPGLKVEDVGRFTAVDRKFPVVLSLNCASGLFDNETVDLPENRLGEGYGPDKTKAYLAESLVRKADGALAVIADTRTSISALNDQLGRGFFKGMLPRDTQTGGEGLIGRLGDLLNYAKADVASQRVDAHSIREQVLIYNLLGDPTVELPLAKPQELKVRSVVLDDDFGDDGDEPTGYRLIVELEVEGCAECGLKSLDTYVRKERQPMMVVQDSLGNVLGRNLGEMGFSVSLPRELPTELFVTIQGASLRTIKFAHRP